MATAQEALNIQYSGDLRVDALLQTSVHWNYLTPDPSRATNTLYFTFALGGSEIAAAPDHSPLAFNATQQSAARTILDYAGRVTGVRFTETASPSLADLHFANADLDGANTLGLMASDWDYVETGGQLSSYSGNAYVFLDDAEWQTENRAPVGGSASYETLLHEVGHALGLDHPFDDPYALPDDQDNTNNTVMSYDRAGGPKSAFQPYDLLALYWIYGGDGLGGAKGYNSALGPTLQGADSVQPGIVSTGTDGTNGLVGTSGNDSLDGRGGDDFLYGDAGDDRLEGGTGLDRAMYSGARLSYVLTHNEQGWIVRDTRGLEGADLLTGVERLQFSDGHLAIDLDGHAGQVARIIGALFGKAYLARVDYVGIGLDLLDDAMPYAELVALALHTDVFAGLAGSRSNTDFVRLVYRNVVGVEADDEAMAHFVGQLERGEHTQESLAVLACDTDATAQQIDLVGLAQNGLPYLPM